MLSKFLQKQQFHQILDMSLPNRYTFRNCKMCLKASWHMYVCITRKKIQHAFYLWFRGSTKCMFKWKIHENHKTRNFKITYLLAHFLHFETLQINSPIFQTNTKWIFHVISVQKNCWKISFVVFPGPKLTICNIHENILKTSCDSSAKFNESVSEQEMLMTSWTCLKHLGINLEYKFYKLFHFMIFTNFPFKQAFIPRTSKSMIECMNQRNRTSWLRLKHICISYRLRSTMACSQIVKIHVFRN